LFFWDTHLKNTPKCIDEALGLYHQAKHWNSVLRTKGMRALFCAVCIAIVGGWSVEAHAQSNSRTARNASERLKFYQSPRITPRAAREIELEEGTPPSGKVPHDPKIGPEKVLIKQVRFSGNTQFDQNKLSEAVASFLDRPLGVDELAAAARKVADVYHAAGFFTTRVLVPPQEIENGTITLIVLEGYFQKDGFQLLDYSYGKIDVERARRILTRQVDTSKPIEKSSYERALYLIESLPGVHLRSWLIPGTEVGTARLQVHLIETPATAGVATADNFGFYGTGENRVSAALQLDHQFRRHDRHQILASSTGAGERFVGLESMIPVGHDGWTVGLVAAYVDHQNQHEYDANEGRGMGTVFGLEAGYPVILRSDTELKSLFRISHSFFKDEAASSTTQRRNVDALEASLHGNSRFPSLGTSETTYELKLVTGNVDIKTGSATDRSKGFFAMSEAHLLHHQHLAGNWSALVYAKAQYGSQNLDGLFRCGIGGPLTNRGFAVGEVSADACFLTNLEIRYDVPQPPIADQAYIGAFVDYARSRRYIDPVPGQRNFSDEPISVGIASEARWAKGGGARFIVGMKLNDTDEARLIGHDIDYSKNDVRFWLQAFLVF
jgi:hemolysin activation/secretion protein